MFKLLGLAVVLIGVFSLGFYAGQRSFTDVGQAVVTLSRDALDKAMGMGLDRNLTWQSSVLEAKASVVRAKSELLDRDYGDASRALDKALDSLEAANHADRDTGRVDAVHAVATKIRHARVSIAAGRVPRSHLDEIEKDVDRLLKR